MRALLLALLCSSGCMPTSFQLWQSRPAVGAPQGRVAIKLVANKRPAGKGANDWQLIGHNRNEPDVPLPFRIDAAENALNPAYNSLHEMFTRFTSDVLISASIGLAQPGDPAPSSQVAIELHEMWCDGAFVTFYGAIGVAWVVLDARGVEVARVPLRVQARGIHCLFAYIKALGLLYDQLLVELAKPSIRAALISPAPGG